MVFVKDFKKEFYDEIQHQRVLVLVSFDIDALCACRILQYLFQCDHVLYTIVPVTGKQDLERAYLDNLEGIQFVILLNCGATTDVIESLQPEEHVVFYICDSHRPVDVHNIYNQIQVRLLMKEDDLENIPDFTEVFRDEDSDEDDSGNDNEASDGGKRRRFDEASLEKRMKKRKWEENRKRVIFEYTEFSGYGLSAALLLYEMAWKMSKDTNDLLWLAIIGSTDQYINQRVDRDKYIDCVGQLQSHVSRLNHRPEESESSLSVDCLKISFDQELKLSLYRHWTIFESICHSEYVACKFRIWTMKGKKRLHEFLADMGIPLAQCKQKFVSMDVSFKESFKDLMSKHLEKYNMTEQEMFLPSFHAQYGYKNRYCAMDVVYACESVLESVEKGNSSSDNFLKALDILNRSKTDCMEDGLEDARLQLRAIVTQVQSFLDMNQVISAGPFLYAFIQEGSPDAQFFAKPLCLSRLAKFALEAYCSTAKSKKAKTLPFVLGAHNSTEMGTMLVIGIPPVLDKSLKNCFGKAFEQAAQTTNSRTLHDQFDTHIIELISEDRSKFFDALISLLQ